MDPCFFRHFKKGITSTTVHLVGLTQHCRIPISLIRYVDSFALVPRSDSLGNKYLPKCGLLLKERICSDRSKFISLRVGPY